MVRSRGVIHSAVFAGAMLVGASASAADWAGFYIGLHGGYASGESHWTDDPVFGGASLGTHNIDGGLAGGQAGYNFQVGGPWVVGVEADASWTDVDGSHVDQFASDLHTHLDALGTLTARAGYMWGIALAYVKGGAAWGRYKYEDFLGVGQGLNGGHDETRWGWTLGAGVEYAVFQNFSLKFEYNYIDFGNDTMAFSGGAGGNFVQTLDNHLHVLKAGLNFRF